VRLERHARLVVEKDGHPGQRQAGTIDDPALEPPTLDPCLCGDRRDQEQGDGQSVRDTHHH